MTQSQIIAFAGQFPILARPHVITALELLSERNEIRHRARHNAAEPWEVSRAFLLKRSAREAWAEANKYRRQRRRTAATEH